MTRPLLLLPALLLGCAVVCGGEKYFVVKIEQSGDTCHDVFTATDFGTLKDYLKKEKPLAGKAIRDVYADWMKDPATRKVPFPLRSVPPALRVTQAGTYTTLEDALKRFNKAEDQLDKMEEMRAGAGMSRSGSVVKRRLAQQHAAALTKAMEMFHKRMTELKSEAGLSEPPLKGLARSTPENKARLQRRRISRAATKALQYLVANGSGGTWAGGNASPLVTSAVASLAFMGASPKGAPYRSILERSKRVMLQTRKAKDGSPRDTLFANWFLGFRGLFLAEYYAHYPSPDVLAALEENVDLIHQTQNGVGCWHHGHGAMQKYEVHAAGLQCLATLGLARSYGIKVNEKAIEKSLANMANASGKVGYSTKNGHFAPGRTAGVAWAYFCCDNEGSSRFVKMTSIVNQRQAATKNDHASPGLHLLWRALFAHMHGEKAWQTFWDLFGEKILALQTADGSFVQAPWADADMEKLCGPNYRTALYALILVLPRGHLQGLFKRSMPQAKAAARSGRKAWLGMKLEETEKGLRVVERHPKGSAATLGIPADAVLTKLNSKNARKLASLDELFKKVKPGDTLLLTFQTPGKGLRRQVVKSLFARPSPKGWQATDGWR